MINSYTLRMARHNGEFGSYPCGCKLCRNKREMDSKTRMDRIIVIVFFCLFMMGSCRIARASTSHTELSSNSITIVEPNIAGYSLNEWCAAIYKAEGGSHTKHPYGILAHYKHTTALQACRNTVLHKYRNYSKLTVQVRQSKRFLEYLASTYCPVGATNDPGGLNKNWVSNVSYYLINVSK